MALKKTPPKLHPKKLTPAEQAAMMPPLTPGRVVVSMSVEALCLYIQNHKYEPVGWRGGLKGVLEVRIPAPNLEEVKA